MATTSLATQPRPHGREEPGAALPASLVRLPGSIFPPLGTGSFLLLKPPLFSLQDQECPSPGPNKLVSPSPWHTPPGGVPGTQPLLPNSMDPTRQQGHPNMGGSMQRMNPPRGMGPMGPGPQTDPWLSLQNYGSGMRPPPNSLGPAMPGINMGPGAGRPWPNPNSANSVSTRDPLVVVAPQEHPSCLVLQLRIAYDQLEEIQHQSLSTPKIKNSTNSSDNIYTMINPVPPGGSRSNFPMGPGSDGPMGGMGGMEPHHMNGSLGSGDIDGLPKNSPNNISGISNPPGTPRDDGELGGNFLHSFQNDNRKLAWLETRTFSLRPGHPSLEPGKKNLEANQLTAYDGEGFSSCQGTEPDQDSNSDAAGAATVQPDALGDPEGPLSTQHPWPLLSHEDPTGSKGLSPEHILGYNEGSALN
ncbi:Single-stranded DNA-binding protein 3 [Pteropus alecto]|uniref:Single-stranded DNA-binding protein 3 n=1 Tax=Pteropus alecto TaxID=9402 RepID=L5K394_PTEAL|nr:Single-stranded DNA-binding protein 3 [Pteropus alecto]